MPKVLQSDTSVMLNETYRVGAWEIQSTNFLLLEAVLLLL